MNILEYNREAWNRQSSAGNEWSTPVSSEVIRAAQDGDWQLSLTPVKNVPKSWFGDLEGKDILCLASGGGQQAPVLAAAGARVVSFDLSDEQLAKDQMVAQRHKLDVQCIRGDMADLGQLSANFFDLIFHPVANVFVPDIEIVWKQCYRVLKPTGSLLAGFMNPSFFLFDHDEAAQSGKLEVKFQLPYAEPDSLDMAAQLALAKAGRALEFSHSLDTQIGGQLKAGFMISGFYEDSWSEQATPLNSYCKTSIATNAIKMGYR